MHAFDLDGDELWRIPTSTKNHSFFPPANDAFSVEIKKQTHTEDNAAECKYASKKRQETVSLSEYQMTSEYATTSEYRQKSDYQTNRVS